MPSSILSNVDWAIISGSFLLFLLIGAIAARHAGKDTQSFFLSGRNLPWWMLGISMVATTFSADTPNLVADIVRRNGVSGNWAWWAFLLTGMLTVFVYAKLWRRAGILTDLEFYTLRYSGKGAKILRGFRAVYLGFVFNAIIMATVILAGMKIAGVLLGWDAYTTVITIAVITVFYSAAGGLKSVVLTDILQFVIAMVGAIGAAIYVINMPEIGSMGSLLTHPEVVNKIDLLPDFSDSNNLIILFIIPIAVQWWSVWYPGAEPGGGGYIAQRILATKTEKGAMSATLLFNVAHYALRPWPWIIVALASLIIYPNIPDLSAPVDSFEYKGLSSLAEAFPNIASDKIGHDLAYSAMLLKLPSGLLGIVLVSLSAALMSTISTHLNWGSSYLINDFYKPFIDKDASERKLVFMGRISTVLLMLISIFIAFNLENALDSFNILLQIGAGTGLIYILRWFWYRINVVSEITAMVVSFLIAVYFQFIHTKLGFDPIETHWELVFGVLITSIFWIGMTLLTPPSDIDTLKSFYKKIKPHPTGWQPIINKFNPEEHQESESNSTSLGLEIGSMFVACITVYSTLFCTGYFLYGEYLYAWITAVITILGTIILLKWWRNLKFS